MNALSPDQFEALMRRLDPDREVAGQRYEDLRHRVLTVFAYRRCPNPEELADETMDRVARKLLEMGDTFEGSEPSRFVFGVAWKMAKEAFHRRRDVSLPDAWDLAAPPVFEDDNAGSRGGECLERCLRKLSEPDRDLVLRYYQEEKRAKIKLRSALARERGVSANALRLRIHRMTQQLRECVADCLESSTPRPVRLRQG